MNSGTCYAVVKEIGPETRIVSWAWGEADAQTISNRLGRKGAVCCVIETHVREVRHVSHYNAGTIRLSQAALLRKLERATVDHLPHILTVCAHNAETLTDLAFVALCNYTKAFEKWEMECTDDNPLPVPELDGLIAAFEEDE